MDRLEAALWGQVLGGDTWSHPPPATPALGATNSPSCPPTSVCLARQWEALAAQSSPSPPQTLAGSQHPGPRPGSFVKDFTGQHPST